MYLDHFKLDRRPFVNSPDTDRFYEGSQRGSILNALIYSVMSGEGIVKVVGEIGSGKTMICRMLGTRLPNAVDLVYIPHPNLTPEQILQAIAFDLKIPLSNYRERFQVIHALHQALLKKHAENRRVVLLVEEAQNMALETLEEIRLLSNLETKQDKLLQIVLFGQPELDALLESREVRQLKDRITNSYWLPPFSTEGTREYLAFRMQAAGYRGLEAFTPGAVKRIARDSASAGLVRRLNTLAHKSLMAAYINRSLSVEPRHVQAALKDESPYASPPLTINWSPPQWLTWRVLGGGGGLLALAATAAWLTFSPGEPQANLAMTAMSRSTEESAPAKQAPAVEAPPVETSALEATPPAKEEAPQPTAAETAQPDSEPEVARRESLAPEEDEVIARLESPASDAEEEAAQPTEAEEEIAQPEEAAPPPRTVATAKETKPAFREIPTDWSMTWKPVSPAAQAVAAHIDASNRWLTSSKRNNLSLQLLMINDEERMESGAVHDLLRRYGRDLGARKLRLFEVERGDSRYMVLFFGEFPNLTAGKKAIKSMPRRYKRHKPFLRYIKSIQKEVAPPHARTAQSRQRKNKEG